MYSKGRVCSGDQFIATYEQKDAILENFGGLCCEMEGGARSMEELLAISGDEWMKLDRNKEISDECCYVVIDGDIISEDLDKALKDAAKISRSEYSGQLLSGRFFK